jgi:redox-sensitive bicupin YhaK (pirin superfamily)
MSAMPHNEPRTKPGSSEAIELVIESRVRDIGGFTVRRLLPFTARRMVGPFIFFDHMGPVRFDPGRGIDVRPHPHIALATITYLFEGEILHRDSLGNVQLIMPGEVNWMLAGQGIVHSERTPPAGRARGATAHGIQTWVALPTDDEHVVPRFEHHGQDTIPVVRQSGIEMRVIAGSAYGVRAPTSVLSPTLYVHATLATGATLSVDDAHEQRAVYVVSGSVDCAGERFGAGTMIVLRPRASVSLSASSEASVMMVGGAPLDGARHIWWNFVASSEERIEQAKAAWRDGQFPKIPGDDLEFIPLPEGS